MPRSALPGYPLAVMQACGPWNITTEGVAGPSSPSGALVLLIDAHDEPSEFDEACRTSSADSNDMVTPIRPSSTCHSPGRPNQGASQRPRSRAAQTRTGCAAAPADEQRAPVLRLLARWLAPWFGRPRRAGAGRLIGVTMFVLSALLVGTPSSNSEVHHVRRVRSTSAA